MKKYFTFFAAAIMMVVALAAASCSKYEENLEAKEQEKPVEPTPTPDAKLLDVIVLSENHIAFDKEAVMGADSVAKISCDNSVVLREIYNDNSKRDITLPFAVENFFSIKAPKALVFESLDAKIGKAYAFSGDVCDVEGFIFSASFVSNQVLGPVMHKEQDFANQLHACPIKPQTLTITALNTVVIRFWDNEQTDFAELKLTVPMSEKDTPVTFVKLLFQQEHLNFIREAVRSGNQVVVSCTDNLIIGKLFSDGSLRDTKSLEIGIDNIFNMTVPTTVNVKSVSEIINKTYDFDGATCNVEGSVFRFVWQSAKVNGEVVYEGKDYSDQIHKCPVAPKTLTVTSANSVVVKFWDQNKNDYAQLTLTVNFKEDETPATFVKLLFQQEHLNFTREAVRSGNQVVVSCTDNLIIGKLFSDGSLRDTKSLEIGIDNIFNMTVPTTVNVKSVSEIINKTYDFDGATCNVEGSVFRFVWQSAKVNGEVVYEGKDYSDQIHKCPVAPKTLTVTSANSVVVKFWDQNKNDYAQLTLTVNFKEDETPATFVKLLFQQEHLNFTREAVRSGNQVVVSCTDNLIIGKLFSDGSLRDTKSLEIGIDNIFNMTVPTTVNVKSVSEIINKTYDFDGATCNVEGSVFRFVWQSAKVNGEVVYEGKDYSDQIHKCPVAPKTLTVTSANSVVVKFWDQNRNDYAELKLSVNFKEDETPIEGPTFVTTEVSSKHVAYVLQATLSGYTSTVWCKNFAQIRDLYSDGSYRNEETFDYLVKSLFTFNAPVMEVEDTNTVVGRSYPFQNGYATVGGKLVRMTWESSTVVDNIMHNGKDYSSKVLACQPVARTLTVLSAKRGVIRFYKEDPSDYAELCVSLSIRQKEKPVTFEKTVWGYRHVAWTSATLSGSSIEARGNNLSDFYELWSDGSHRYAETIAYTCVNRFSHNIPAMELENTNTVVGKSFNFRNGVVTVAGYNVSVKRLSAEVEGSVVYRGKDYTKEITPCVLEARTITFTSTSTAVIRFYGEDSSDYVEVTVPVSIKEEETPVTFEKTVWGYRHVAWMSATLSGSSIEARGNNLSDFYELWSDGSHRYAETIAYTCVNRFSHNIPAMELENTNTVVGKSFNFRNGVVTVAGYNVSVKRLSAEVEGSVVYRGKDYTKEITPCVLEARTITFTSTSTAVIRFYGEDSSDYVEVTIPVSIKETKKLVEISRQFVHKAFRPNAVVNGQNIAAVCDNAAYFIMKYNDGTQDAPVEVAYTVTNNFRVSSLEFKVVGKSEIVGKTYNFNNGTTVIAGKTVNVTFVSREVSNIMFGGTNYKSEAPACVATVRSITINDGSARIVFNGEGETVTAVVPCTITETDSIKGKIICGYATDSYVAGSQGVSVREGTYIHILALYNGVYTIYSKKVGADAWGMETVVSSADTAKRPFAFINNALNKVGYISVAEEYESGSYLINYSDFNGTLYKAIGKTSVTISGQPNRNPVRGTWSNGSITVDGQTFFISGTQN